MHNKITVSHKKMLKSGVLVKLLNLHHRKTIKTASVREKGDIHIS